MTRRGPERLPTAFSEVASLVLRLPAYKDLAVLAHSLSDQSWNALVDGIEFLGQVELFGRGSSLCRPAPTRTPQGSVSHVIWAG